MGGGTLFLDPVWLDGTRIDDASKASIETFDGGKIDGTLAVGQNSVLSLGTTDTTLAEKAFAKSGLKWGENDITAAMYIAAPQTMDASGVIVVDGTVDDITKVPSSLGSDKVKFAKQSLLMIDVGTLGNDVALVAGSESGSMTIEGNADDGAKLRLVNAKANAEYKITKDFTLNGTWERGNISLNHLVKIDENLFNDGADVSDKSDDKLLVDGNGNLTIKTEQVKAADALPNAALPNLLDKMAEDGLINTDSPDAGIKFLSNAVHMDKTEAIRQINAAARGAEGAGATRLGVVAAWDIADAVQSRLSLAQESKVSGESGIWAQYVHNKDKVDGMGATGGSLNYSNSYNGIVVGGDFARQGNFQSGVAFAYGSGDGSGSALSNDFDFWGLSYYGSVKRGDGNLLFDVGYSKTSSDISGLFEASPDTKVFTLGVRGEKQIVDASGARYVPYVGLRYMNIDTGSYNATMAGGDAFHYGTDKANLWLLPIGVSISSENTSGQWTVRPMADLSYVFAFGDKDSAMRVTTPGVNAADQVGYDIMDSGFFVGRLGIEAAKDNQTWGLGYAYQKGSHAENNRFYANVKFSF